jgi:hypothetical protein
MAVVGVLTNNQPDSKPKYNAELPSAHLLVVKTPSQRHRDAINHVSTF